MRFSPLAIAGAALTTLVGLGSAAAQDIVTDDQPAVRRQLLMRDDRLELGGFVGTTLGDTYQATPELGLLGRYYFSDMFGVGLQLDVGPAAVDTDIASNFQSSGATRSSDVEYAHPLLLSSIHLQYVPWIGKVNVFDTKVVKYDLGVQLGLGGAMMSSDADDLAGFKPGGEVGVALRVFLTPALTGQVRVSDYLYSADDALYVGGSPPEKVDEKFGNHFVFAIGFSYLTPAPKGYSR